MNQLASPLLIGLGVWLMIENVKLNQREEVNSKNFHPNSCRFVCWSLSVIIITIIIEAIGVKTGKIFGNYTYGSNLSPYIGGVPLAIGFAWLTMLLSSIPLAELILTHLKSENILLTTLLTALLMTVFDFFMEPAAIKLDYWTWADRKIPCGNYLAWFFISLCLITGGKLLKILPQKLSTIGIHAYFAQLIYFLLVSIG